MKGWTEVNGTYQHYTSGTVDLTMDVANLNVDDTATTIIAFTISNING